MESFCAFSSSLPTAGRCAGSRTWGTTTTAKMPSSFAGARPWRRSTPVGFKKLHGLLERGNRSGGVARCFIEIGLVSSQAAGALEVARASALYAHSRRAPQSYDGIRWMLLPQHFGCLGILGRALSFAISCFSFGGSAPDTCA